MLTSEEKDKVARSITSQFNKAGSRMPRLTVGLGEGIIVFTQRSLTEKNQKQIIEHAEQVLGRKLDKEDLGFKVLKKTVVKGATRKK